MLVYGDATHHEHADAMLARIAAALARVDATAAGLARHAALVAALLDAGELAQAIADHDFRSAGSVDAASPAADAAIALTMAIARRAATSWTSAFADAGAAAVGDIERCAALAPRDALAVRQPEGYAFYTLYPEGYLVAARALAARRWQVIGVRSIGTSLACMVAVGLAARAPITLRPFGDAFARMVAADVARIDRDVDAYAIVDEGPGLSGSSIAAVARWLVAAGIAEDRIHLFAGHRRGPGPHASADARALWQRADSGGRIHATSFDDLVLDAPAPAHRLDRWVAELVGPLAEPLREIGGGAWRTLHARAAGAPLPPVHPWQERRKFVAVARGARFLVKFNGLGRRGDAKAARARALGDAGFTPAPIGTCHGFLVERWLDGGELAVPLRRARRAAVASRVAAYLGFRSRFAAPDDAGASIAALAAMARQNSSEALGAENAAAWDRWTLALPGLAGEVRRIETDNRMHAWEWVVAGDAIVKCDAIDHHAGHDLVGCQDVAWDVAGAVVELELCEADQDAIADHVGRARGAPLSPALLAFCRAAYLAFQLGADDDAKRATHDPLESARWHAARERHAALLRATLASAQFRRAPR